MALTSVTFICPQISALDQEDVLTVDPTTRDMLDGIGFKDFHVHVASVDRR